MTLRLLLVLLYLLCQNFTTAQPVTGTIKNFKSKEPVAYVNIGISQKNVGTVSDADGNFKLDIPAEFDADTLLFTCIGFHTLKIPVSQFKNNGNVAVSMQEKILDLKEVVIKPRTYKSKILGVSTDRKLIYAGFKDNQLGYEMGVLMKVKKSAVLKRVDLNISTCSYDSVFYRLNIYSEKGKMKFENILREPIYINLPKEKVLEKISIDLQQYDLTVEGNFLVTVELIKDLGPGVLYFCTALQDKTYYRKTSQGAWDTVGVGISVSVLADVEQ